MSYRGPIVVVFIGCLMASVAAQAEQVEFAGDDIAFMAKASSVTARGAIGKHPGIYTLELEYHPADPKVNHKAMLVYAEPSHTLLFVLWNGDLDDPDFDEMEYREYSKIYEALAGSVGMHGASYPKVHIKYDPTGDTQIEVQILDEFLVSRTVSGPALANDGSFGATTFFVNVAGGGDPKPLYKHCCDCGDGEENCGTMCIYCSGPAFECMCAWPYCEITCDWS